MAIEIDGVYVGPFARAESRQARRHGVTPERPGHAASRPYLDLALANLPYAPRVGDRTTRLKDGKRYHVAEVRPDGTGRAQLDLNELGTMA